RASLPERAARIRGRAIGIDRPFPVADEVVEPAILALHEQDEVDESGGPLTQSSVVGVAIEIEEQDHGTRGVIDARDALEAPVARGEAPILIVRVHPDRHGTPADRRDAPGEPRDLPDHRDQGSRLAMISFTEKSAAA